MSLTRSLLSRMVVLLVLGLLVYEGLVRLLTSGGQDGLLDGGLARWVAGLASVALVATVFDWMVVRRIHRLNKALTSAEAGEFRPGLRSRSADQIGLLTASIDHMITTLRENYEELKTHDELRRRLVANVSHELRTPLTSIQGYLETARQDKIDNPQLAGNLEICHREARRLSRLVQDLFQLSKLDTHQLEFQFETVSLVELADQIGLAFEQRMEDKQIQFATAFPDDPLEVVADGNRLGQVITNLLGNAVVFTPPGGQVTLSCAREGELAVCRVADTGVGIGTKELPLIFDSFFHLEKSRTRNLGGTGLGLAICKAIVDAHGGQLAVESQEGHGTTFAFRLKTVDPGLLE